MSEDLDAKKARRLRSIENEYYFRKDVFDDHMNEQRDHLEQIKRNKILKEVDFEKRQQKIAERIAKSDLQTQCFREKERKEQLLAAEKRKLKEEDLRQLKE